jgi:cell division septation protein DedD
VLVLALLVVSPVFCSQTLSPAGQLQHTTKKEVDKKRTEHSTCYAVQVGAYKERAEVGAMLDKLAEGFPYRMMLTQVGARDNMRWRLRVLATSRVEALKVSERLLAEQGVQAWIIPIPCAYSVKGRLNRTILALHTETPEPANPALIKEVVPPPRESHVSTTALKAESPALSERTVWVITIATFLDTAFVVLLICILYFQREQIREALRRPKQRRMERRTAARVPLELSSLCEPSIREITRTENVSSHGARVVTRSSWRLNDGVLVKFLRGGLRTRARVAYLKPSTGAFVVGLQFSTGDRSELAALPAVQIRGATQVTMGEI